MEHMPKCKTMIAIYNDPKIILSGPHRIEFDVKDKKQFHVCVEQGGKREIVISSKSDVSIYDLHTAVSQIERLLMLFDGRFITLSEYRFLDSDTLEDKMLESYAENIIRNRLSYFSSADFCDFDGMIEYDTVFTPELFDKWKKLLDELDIVHQMYLYIIEKGGIPVDLRCAFLIELSEPLVEIVKEHTRLFASLCPGPHGTSLKICLKSVINEYGAEIL